MADFVRQFHSKHNLAISFDLEDPATEHFRGILTFLMRSRIYYALTHSPTLRITYLRQFWANAVYDCQPNPPVIRTRVNDVDIAFSAAYLRIILRLGNEVQENGPTSYPLEMRAGAFQRMGYVGDVTTSQFTKSFLYGQWRYLMHVLLVSFRPKKAGFDTMNHKMQSGRISLIYNKPYCFSQFFFDELVQQIRGSVKDKFILYPRFVMMIIQGLVQNLPAIDPVVYLSTVDKKIFLHCLSHSSRRQEADRPQATPLFGAVIDADYAAPPNDGWWDLPQPEDEVDTNIPAQPRVAIPDEHREIVEDVLIQLEQPQLGGDPIVLEIAEAVVADVLQSGHARDIVAEVDAFVPDPHAELAQELEQIDAYQGDANDVMQQNDDVIEKVGMVVDSE